jgi:hypothetical protein
VIQIGARTASSYSAFIPRTQGTMSSLTSVAIPQPCSFDSTPLDSSLVDSSLDFAQTTMLGKRSRNELVVLVPTICHSDTIQCGCCTLEFTEKDEYVVVGGGVIEDSSEILFVCPRLYGPYVC